MKNAVLAAAALLLAAGPALAEPEGPQLRQDDLMAYSAGAVTTVFDGQQGPVECQGNAAR